MIEECNYGDRARWTTSATSQLSLTLEVWLQFVSLPLPVVNSLHQQRGVFVAGPLVDCDPFERLSRGRGALADIRIAY